MLSTRERSGDDRFVLLDLVQGMGLRTLDGATRLFELNLRATRTLMDEATARLRAAFDPQARGGVSVPSMPNIERATSYGRDVYRIVAGTNAELVELVQRHVRVGWIEGAARLGPQSPAQDPPQPPAACILNDTQPPVRQSAVAFDAMTAPDAVIVHASPEAAAANESAPASEPSDPAVPPKPSQSIMAQMPDPPAAPLAAQPIVQAVHEAIEQVVEPDAMPASPEASRRPRATRTGRSASRKSAPNAT